MIIYWRHTQKLPKHGQITIFDRSRYENVLISKYIQFILIRTMASEIVDGVKIDKTFFWNGVMSKLTILKKYHEREWCKF